MKKIFAVSILSSLMALAKVQAAEIPIVNHSFENPAQADGQFTPDSSLPPGWDGIGNHHPVANPMDDWFPGTSENSPGSSPIDGLNIGGLNTGSMMFQDLSATVQPGVSYRLTMLVGHRLGVPFGEVTVTLRAGEIVVAEGIVPEPTNGTFAPFELTYVSPGSGDVIGETVRIQMQCGGPAAQAWFDNLKLTAEPVVPPPSEVEIPIANHSFEDPAQDDGNYTPDSFPVPGWMGTGFHRPVANPSDDWFPGTMDGGAGPNPIDGLNIGGLNNGSTMYQDLPATLQPGETYKLSMLVGRRLNVPFGGPTVSLLAGENVLAEAIPAEPANGEFLPFLLKYESPSSGEVIGQTLRIRIRSSGVNAQAWFDNLKLTVGSTPPPPSETEISIVNHSFEEPAQTDGSFTPDGFPVPGWTGTGSHYPVANPGDDWFPGTSEENTSGSPIDGLNIGGLNTGSKIHQDLTAKLQANRTYRLTMLVGRRLGNPFGTPTVSLLAGEEVLAEAIPNEPQDGAFAPFELTFDSPETGALIGQTLRIQIRSEGVDAQVWFDNLKLVAEVTPPPPAGPEIAIANHSFEEPAQPDGGYTPDGSAVPGWNGSGPHHPVANPRDDWFPGTSATNTVPSPIDGLNIGGLNTGSMMYQDLPATVQPGTTYKLSMLVGHRLGVPFGTPTVTIFAGEEVIAEAVPPAPADGTFAQFELTYESPANGDVIGKALRLQLRSSGVAAQAWFDNLKLTFGPTPPPVPRILAQPVNLKVLAGSTAEFTVAVGGAAPFTFAWSKGGVAIEGATNASLVIDNAQAADEGGYSVEISNEFGSVTSSVAILTVGDEGDLIVHPDFATREGGGGSSSLTQTIRLQESYSSSMFPSGKILITEIRWRPSGVVGKAFTNTIADFRLNLSTFAGAPSEMSTTFASNVGPDDTEVFSGPLEISSTFTPSDAGTKEFDIVVPLMTPFIYDPSKGSLLVDIRNLSGGDVSAVDAGATSDGRIKRVFRGGSVTAPTGVTDNGADVLKIVYGPANIAPYISRQPKSQGVTEEGTLELSVAANGADPLSYQWHFGGEAIPDAVASSLVITNVQSVNAGDYFVVVANGLGSVTSQVATITVDSRRTLSLVAPAEMQEGTRVSVLVDLTSKGDVGGMTFNVKFDTNYLKEANLVWAPELEGLFNLVNYSPTGQVRATFALPGTVVSEGHTSLATINFLLRSVPEDLSTLLKLEILDASSAVGEPLLNGNIAVDASIAIKKRLFVGDNNANQRIDIGDVSVMLAMLTGVEQMRPWDNSNNDLNTNGGLDSGDTIKGLRIAAGIDPQPEGAGEPEIGAAGGNGNALTPEWIVLSPGSTRALAGETVTYQILLRDIRSSIAGAIFTLDYPTNALRLLNTQSHKAGSMVPLRTLSMWNVAPAQNDFVIQNGRITFASSSPEKWPTSNGVLAEITFEVQPAASAQHLWPLTLRAAEITPDGYGNRALVPASGSFIGRDPLPGAIVGAVAAEDGSFSFTATGDPGAPYRIETTTDFSIWTSVGSFQNATGTFTFQLPSADGGFRFFRVRPGNE